MSVLAVDPAAPWYLKAAAEAILVLHIGGGSVGMISGAVALAAPKRGRVHRLSGRVFFGAMLTMATIGATVAPFVDSLLDSAPNVIAGVMTLYLLLTSWATVRRRTPGFGAAELGGLAAALTVCAAGIVFILMARASPTGTIGTTPPQAFYLFVIVGSIAAISDLKVILQGGVSGAPRLARHLWRMCAALGIAAGSFFFGQQQLLPKAMLGSPLQYAPVFAPLVLMVFWQIRIRFKNRLVPSRPRRDRSALAEAA